MSSWHWVDRGCDDYAKAYVSKALKGLVASKEDVVVTISEVGSVYGDATVCTKRGKTFGVYDLSFKLQFEAERQDKSGKVIGCVDVSDFDSMVTDDDRIQLNVMVKSAASDNPVSTKDVMDILRAQLFSISKKLGESMASGADLHIVSAEGEQLSQAMSQPLSEGAYSTLSGYSEDLFLATDAERAFEFLTNLELIACWSGAGITATPNLDGMGSSYIAFEGRAEFQFMESSRPTKLNMKWRLSKWRPGHYATIKMQLSDMKNPISFRSSGTSTTLIQFTASDIPEDHLEKVKDFFFKWYWEALNKYFSSVSSSG